MKLIFCVDPLDNRQPDSAYESEVAAAEKLGIHYELISYEALVYDNEPLKAVRRVTEYSGSEPGIYRGWMLKPDQYKLLYEALSNRGITLINDPAAYTHCHYLPESYSLIQPYTPKSVWLDTDADSLNLDKIMRIIEVFGSGAVVVKDYVKSQKHDWNEAFYIPSASDQDAVERVVRRFIELQDNDLNKGLVFREFVALEPIGKHSKSGMPLTLEFRVFFLDGEPIYVSKYWEEGVYAREGPEIQSFYDVAKLIKSRFFTMDIAKRADGQWMIVELGDAQVAGLPDDANAEEFYAAIDSHVG
jgi:hypothetical protein